MVGIAEASAAFNSIKVALDMVRGVQALRSETDINQAIIDIQRTLLEAQGAALQDREKHMALILRINELEAKVAIGDRWEAEKQRYALTEFPTGRFAYLIRETERGNDPVHRICVKCFDEGKKSVLQTKNKHSGGESVACPTCKDTLTLHAFPPAEVRRSTSRLGRY